MKYDNQLRYAKTIIREYDGSIPLASWLKEFFRNHKQMGSTDRRTLSAITYSFYRLGHLSFASVDDRLAAAIAASPDLNTLKEYFGYLFPEIDDEKKIFPAFTRFSDGVDHNKLAKSMLIQPLVYARIRPGKKVEVERKLKAAGVEYSVCDENCIALEPGVPLQKILNVNAEVVIQDKTSQQTGILFTEAKSMLDQDEINVWDCCAASGGKSIMAYDTMGNIKLTVSDIRESIIHNLSSRFHEAGIKGYKKFVADLSAPANHFPRDPFDVVIADVPCSGSGTWARTPEQLYFFNPDKIAHYRNLQKSITKNVIASVRKGGFLVYITCSVFRQENEDVLAHLGSLGFRTVYSRLFVGYEDRADTLFGAILTNSEA